MNAPKLEPPYSAVMVRSIAAAAVALIAETKTFGESITRAELDSLFGIEWPKTASPETMRRIEGAFLKCFSVTRRALLTQHQMALKAHQKRWEIIVPRNQARHAAEVARRGFADVAGQARALATHVRRDMLTPAQQKEADDTANRLAGIEMFAADAMSNRPTLRVSRAAALPAKTDG